MDAIVGKHIRIHCPKQSETLFHSYEGFFILFNVGQYGSNNNAGVLANSSIGKKTEVGEMNIPPLRHLGCSFDSLPCYLVGDEIFPIKT